MEQERTCNAGTALKQNYTLTTSSPVLSFWRSCSKLETVLGTTCIRTTVWTLSTWCTGPKVLYENNVPFP
ncbi:hypothetical protein TNCV_3600061 [Trichonephila clavipes]|nr:hypothetical protein TNCV_3600061 [Trichonephila clavipes]